MIPIFVCLFVSLFVCFLLVFLFNSQEAYTSSWAGPQNPNGGDESIEFFLTRAKNQVETARGILKDVIDILALSS